MGDDQELTSYACVVMQMLELLAALLGVVDDLHFQSLARKTPVALGRALTESITLTHEAPSKVCMCVCVVGLA